MSHTSESNPRFTNRLAQTTSPYLLQHAHNPVDWWPWGEEAFAEARRRDVPIFLSIGYSTCYWCHVMERESFESEAIAHQMNEKFVCVKLDREERPDVDEIYMAATVTMTGHGGWPMSVFLNPHTLEPFFCGTYYPATARPGMQMPSFPRVLEGMSRAWQTQRTDVEEQAKQLAGAVREQVGNAGGKRAALGTEQVGQALEVLLRIFDRVEGGFGRAPKFPQPVFLDFLLDLRTRVDEQSQRAIDQALRVTLDRMSVGGMFDQVGGGFHRYSVDAYWTVPHFEKMLYDNAQLAAVYARAGAAFGDAWYKRIAERTIGYVLREMRGRERAFFSAQDAEVDGREGLNYLFTPEEVEAALGEDASVARAVYGLNHGANFQDPHHPGEPASWVLRLEKRPDEMSERVVNATLDRINAKLLEVRSKRKQPRLDDKVLSAWNGLMVHGLAVASLNGLQNVGGENLLKVAQEALESVLAKLVAGDGSLMRSYRAGVAGNPGTLEDAGAVLLAMTSLAQAKKAAGHERAAWTRWVEVAERHLATARRLFCNADGRWHDSREGQSDLFTRGLSTHDGAVPAGISMLLHAVLGLAELAESDAKKREHLRLAVEILGGLSGRIADSPIGTVNSTRGLLRLFAVDGDAAAVLAAGVGEPQVAEVQKRTSSVDAGVVEFYAGVDRVTVTRDVPGLFRVLVKIADGYHVVAADPGDLEDPSQPGKSVVARGLTPFRVGLQGGSGLRVFADYPKGEPDGVPEFGVVRVYRGEFEFEVVVEYEGEDAQVVGQPILNIAFQACSDQACLRPGIVEFDVAIDWA
jgi:uncharacterized protein YyaL (SSP411 family)